MDNPYQSPQEPSTPFGGLPSDDGLRPRGLVNHVRAVAILMLVQGGLEVVMAALLGTLAVAIGPMSHAEMRQPPNVVPPQQLFWMVTVVYGGFAAVVLLAAVLHIAAGARNCRFRGRTLGIVALSTGVLTLFGCYCFPTAIGLGVYGLIVYLNPSVSEAFRLGESGRSSREILNTFQR